MRKQTEQQRMELHSDMYADTPGCREMNLDGQHFSSGSMYTILRSRQRSPAATAVTGTLASDTSDDGSGVSVDSS